MDVAQQDNLTIPDLHLDVQRRVLPISHIGLVVVILFPRIDLTRVRFPDLQKNHCEQYVFHV